MPNILSFSDDTDSPTPKGVMQFNNQLLGLSSHNCAVEAVNGCTAGSTGAQVVRRGAKCEKGGSIQQKGSHTKWGKGGPAGP